MARPLGSAVADHISYPPHSLANASKKKCNFKTKTKQDLEELVLLYRFMPSIPRETLKTQGCRSNVVNFPQLYKLELASLTRLSPDDGCNRLASVTPSNKWKDGGGELKHTPVNPPSY